MKIFSFILLTASIIFTSQLIAQNSGFENGLTGWTSADSGTWSVNTLAGDSRSGLKSAQLVTSSTSNGKLYNTILTVTSPPTGTNYITVIAWIKANKGHNRVAVGASDGISEYKGAEVNVPASSYIQVEYTFPATNNTIYYPYLYGRSFTGLEVIIHYDDVMIFTSTANAPDLVAPAPATGIVAVANGTQISLTWTPGTDESGGSGIDGALILRRSGTPEPNQNVSNQTNYSATDTLVGPTSVGAWTIVYNGNSMSSFTDDPGVNGIYTYLVYMRDKAYNYTSGTSAARIFVFNGTGLSSSTTTNTRLDGLYLPSTCTFTSNSSSTVTIRTCANISVGGTVINQGNIYTQTGANVAFNDGSTYEYRKNGSVGLTMFSLLGAIWHPGSTCKITGITTTFPNNLDQTFANFIWDCPLQTISDTLSSCVAPTIISGDFTVSNTGTGKVMFSDVTGSNMIGGDFVKNGGTLDAGNGATVILNGIANQNITISGGDVEGVFNLKVDNTNGATLGSNLLVSGVLTLTNGIIETGSNKLAIGTFGSVVRSNGHVWGYLKKYLPTGYSSHQFEIGDNSKYTPAEIEFSNVTTAGNLTVTTLSVDHPDILNSGLNPDKTVNRYYSFTNDGIVFDSSNVNFNFDPDDLDPGANPDHFIVKKYDAPNWTAPKTVGRTQTSTLASGVASFSDFVIGEGEIYTIFTSSSPNGTITPSGLVSVAEGTDQNFIITPNTGYHLDSLIVDELHSDSVTSYTFYYVTTNHSISAYFSINKYTLNVNSANGSVSKDPDQVSYVYGTLVQLTPASDPGYGFANWSGDVLAGHETDNPLTITMDQNRTITATFTTITYTLNVEAENGTVEVNPSAGQYDPGTLVVLTPDPFTGYHFVDWSGDVPAGHESDNPLTVIMDQNRTITANFTINSYTINATAGAGGDITPAGSVNVNYGDTQVFAITPDMNYQLDSLFVDGLNQDSTTSYTFTNVTANHTIYAAFKERLNPVPVLTGIFPAGGYRGDTLIVLFSGSNISADAVINLGAGITSLEQSNIGENLQTKIVISENTVLGFRNFSVTNPPPGGGTSDEMIFTVYNHVPAAFHLIEPADGGMIQLTTISQPITFVWHSSIDPDMVDTLTYILHLPGTPLGDSITVRGDTSVTLDYMDVLTPNTEYFWSVSVTDGYDTVASTEIFSFSTSATILAVDQDGKKAPTDYALYQNYPNPFNPTTTLTYQIPFESNVSVKIYNLLGQLVTVLVDEIQTPGNKSVDWDAGSFPSGLYFYRLEAINIGQYGRAFTKVKKMFLVR